MIGLLIPLRWWRVTGTPTYSEAPERRYVWAPPLVTASEAHPIDMQAAALPQPSEVSIPADPTLSVVTPEPGSVVPPFEPIGIA
jgi:hypothetical protein